MILVFCEDLVIVVNFFNEEVVNIKREFGCDINGLDINIFRVGNNLEVVEFSVFFFYVDIFECKLIFGIEMNGLDVDYIGDVDFDLNCL